MSAGQYDLLVEANATYRLTVTWFNPDNTPKDLTGCTAHMQIRHSVTDTGTPLLDLTDTAGLTLGGTAGTIAILMTKVQTASLNVANAVYDLNVTFPSGGDTARVLEGKVTIDPAVTQ